jgi:hypothetical protein
MKQAGAIIYFIPAFLVYRDGCFFVFSCFVGAISLITS